MLSDDRSRRFKRALLYGPQPMLPTLFTPADLKFQKSARLVDLSLPPPLGTTERGGIVLPNVTITPTASSFSVSGGGFDQQLVRNALLLLDRLVEAENNGIKMGDLRGECGEFDVFQTSRARFEGSITWEVLGITAEETFRRLDEREAGRWSIIRSEDENVFPSERLGEAAALKVKLENALSFPDREVPLEDVLAFKQRRQAELMALRTYLDGLVLEAERNGFSGLAQTHALGKLLSALDDYNDAAREQNFLKRLTDVEVKFSWNQAMAAAPAALLWSHGFTLPALTAAAASLLSSISFESSLGPRSRGARPAPVEYLFRAKNEL